MVDVSEDFLAICEERVELDKTYKSKRVELLAKMRDLLKVAPKRKAPNVPRKKLKLSSK